MKFKLLFGLICFAFNAFAEPDSVIVGKEEVTVPPVIKKYYAKDTVAIAKAKHLRDSLTWAYLKPDPKRLNQFVEEMLKKHITTDRVFIKAPNINNIKKSEYGVGKTFKKLPGWILFVMLVLVVAFGLVRIVFKKQLSMIFEAFYDNRVLSQINKEDNIFSSWYFLFSYIIFSFLIGLFLYMLFQKLGLSFEISGFSLFLTISLLFSVFLGFKILILRLLAYLFELKKVVSDYINIIYLSFFNISLFFIPLTLSIILTVFKENNWILLIGLIFTVLVLVLQVVRTLFQILSNYKLSKFYLILYLCALEICPILVIVKALNI